MKLTLTGIDTRTPPEAISQLLRSGVELGILYSLSQDGNPRYPGLSWILEQIDQFPRQLAIHVCGTMARHSITHLVPDFRDRIARLQINGTVSIQELREICHIYSGTPVITQHCINNQHLVPIQTTNHEILVDHSGGRGLLPARWSGPRTFKALGWAGGLSPDNVLTELHKIADTASSCHDDTSRDWIDMETGVREQDWFSVVRAWEVVDKFHAWRKASQ